MYTKLDVGIDLKIQVLKKEGLVDIGNWAYEEYGCWPNCKDDDFQDLLLELSNMTLGYQFELSCERLKLIANDLIIAEGDYPTPDSPEYNELHFARELKIKALVKRENVTDIGAWADKVYVNRPYDEEPEFLNLLLKLSFMKDGPEFALTHKELIQMADDLMINDEW